MTKRDGPIDAEANLFQIEGEYWTIVFDGLVVRLRDRRGLHYLAYLLLNPQVAVPAQQLLTVGREQSGGSQSGKADPATRERARITVTKAIKAALRSLEHLHPLLAAHLDATIHRGYVCSYTPDPRVPIVWQCRGAT